RAFRTICVNEFLISFSAPPAMVMSRHINRAAPVWALRSRRESLKLTKDGSGLSQAMAVKELEFCLHFRLVTRTMSSQPRILVVDDEPQLTRVLRTGLKSRGYD